MPQGPINFEARELIATLREQPDLFEINSSTTKNSTKNSKKYTAVFSKLSAGQ